MTEEETKAIEAEFHKIQQATMELHQKLSIELAKRFYKAKYENRLDKDGFVYMNPGQLKINVRTDCDGYCMKEWKDSDGVTVIRPFFRCNIGFQPWSYWMHDLGPSETLSVMFWVLHGGGR